MLSDYWYGCCSARPKAPESYHPAPEPEVEDEGCFGFVYKCTGGGACTTTADKRRINKAVLDAKPLPAVQPRPLPDPPKASSWVLGVIKTPLGKKPTYFVLKDEFLLMADAKKTEPLEQLIARNRFTALWRTDDPLVYQTHGQRPFVYALFGSNLYSPS